MYGLHRLDGIACLVVIPLAFLSEWRTPLHAVQLRNLLRPKGDFGHMSTLDVGWSLAMACLTSLRQTTTSIWIRSSALSAACTLRTLHGPTALRCRWNILTASFEAITLLSQVVTHEPYRSYPGDRTASHPELACSGSKLVSGPSLECKHLLFEGEFFSALIRSPGTCSN